MSLKGDETINERLEMFQNQRKKVTEQIQELQNTLDTIEYKCWFYETAKKIGSVDAVKKLPTEKIPKKLRSVKENLEKQHR